MRMKYSGHSFIFFSFNFHFNFKQFLLAIGILILAILLIAPIAYINKILPISKDWAVYFKALEVKRATQEATLIQLDSFPKYILPLFMIAFLPGFFEETFFRGGLQNLLTRWFKGPWAAIILTSIIFSLVHLSYYGFLVRLALGMILGFIFYYGKSLWLNVFCHFLFNGIQITVLYVMTMNGVKNSANIEDTYVPLWIGAMVLLLLLYLFKLYKRTSAIKQSQYIEEITLEDEFHNWTANNS